MSAPASPRGQPLSMRLALLLSVAVLAVLLITGVAVNRLVSRSLEDELSAAEWDRVFRSLGRSVSWFTFSGGEPFLRKDLPEIVESAYRRCRPKVINIPTNATFPERVVGAVERLAAILACAAVTVCGPA